MRAERLLAALDGGGVALGSTLHLSDPAVVETAAAAGYDWLSVVLDHSPLTIADVRTLQLAADLHNLTLLAHVPDPGDPRILQALNLGIGGIVCSHVSDRATAERLVEATRFPPIGDRGAHGSVRSTGYGLRDYDEYLSSIDESVAVGVVIEDPGAVERADEILAVPGLTLAFVGLADLAQALGAGGDLDRERLIESIRHVIGIADQHGIAIGMSPYGFSVRELRELGGRMLVWPGTDYAMLRESYAAHSSRARAEIAEA
jgi:4-hydroxy-2-oxoheptanedioate aldolase